MRKILVFASAVLFSLAACNNQGANGGQTQNNVDGSEVAASPVSSQIAYINIDSLLNRYDMFIDMSEELEAKAKKAESEITSKGRSLERAVADASEKMEKGLVTRSQAAELQTKLQNQEQSFYQFRDKLQMDLAEETQVMQNNVFHNIQAFLAEFNSDYRYGVILTTSGGTPVMHANPALDITEEVIKGLNEKYTKEKK